MNQVHSDQDKFSQTPEVRLPLINKRVARSSLALQEGV